MITALKPTDDDLQTMVAGPEETLLVVPNWGRATSIRWALQKVRTQMAGEDPYRIGHLVIRAIDKPGDIPNHPRVVIETTFHWQMSEGMRKLCSELPT